MEREQSVAQHYAQGSLEQTILEALAASGKDLDRLAAADLAPIDEFHIGGRRATIDFADQLDIAPGLHLLDIGSGLGGASRYFALERGCQVTGIDITVEFVGTAEALAQRLKLTERVSYRLGSALAMPFASGGFDGAYMLHVGMNIEDKASLFAEVRRVLKPGGVFGIYDVMREAEGELHFPVPWASSADMSFVETADSYRRILEGAGFAVEKVRSRRDLAIEFARDLRASAARGVAPSPIGLHITMGPSAPQKAAILLESLERRLVSPTEMICRAI